jgi:hypothetical protein
LKNIDKNELAMTDLPRNVMRRLFVVQIPKVGLADHLQTINAWHRYSAVPQQRYDGQEFCRWCFEDGRIAATFHRRFGGEVMVMTPEMR